MGLQNRDKGRGGVWGKAEVISALRTVPWAQATLYHPTTRREKAGPPTSPQQARAAENSHMADGWQALRQEVPHRP